MSELDELDMSAGEWSELRRRELRDRLEAAETQLAELARLAKAYTDASGEFILLLRKLLKNPDRKVTSREEGDVAASSNHMVVVLLELTAFLATLEGAAGGEASADEKGGR